MAKVILIVIWILAIAGFFIAPESGLAGIARWVFWILLAAHAVECVIFREKLRAAPGSLASNSRVRWSLACCTYRRSRSPAPRATEGDRVSATCVVLECGSYGVLTHVSGRSAETRYYPAPGT